MIKRIKEHRMYWRIILAVGTVLMSAFYFSSFAEVDRELARYSEQAAVQSIFGKNWYMNNADLLENNSAMATGIRKIAWGIIGLFCKMVDACQNVYDKTFGFIDLTNYPEINNLLVKLRPVLVAITVLCIRLLGISIMVRKDKPQIATHFIYFVLAVSCSAWLFSTANGLVTSFKDGVYDTAKSQQAYETVNDNIFDLVKIENKTKIQNLNASKGLNFKKYGGAKKAIKNQNTFKQTNYAETLNWKDDSVGKNAYGWNSDFNNVIQYRELGGNLVENYPGVLGTTIGNEFYYRYTFDFWTCILELGSLVVLYLGLSYKNMRIAYELVTARIMSYMYAGVVTSGERMKQILGFIRDTYIALCISVLSIKLYNVFSAYITTKADGLTRGILLLFLAYIVIDGPNIAQRILGMDAGLQSSVARAMGIGFMAKSALTSPIKGAITGNNTVSQAARSYEAGKQGHSGHGLMGLAGKASKKMDAAKNGDNLKATIKDGINGSTEDMKNGFTGDNNGNSPKGMDSDNPLKEHGMDTGFMDAAMGGGKENLTDAFSNMSAGELSKKLAPDNSAPIGERKDWHSHMDRVFNGEKPKKPSENARAEYKERNYNNAMQVYNSLDKNKNKKEKE